MARFYQKWLDLWLVLSWLESFDIGSICGSIKKNETARGHLNELVKLDLIKPVGPSKGRYYVLA